MNENLASPAWPSERSFKKVLEGAPGEGPAQGTMGSVWEDWAPGCFHGIHKLAWP